MDADEILALLRNPSEELVALAERVHCFEGGCGYIESNCERLGRCTGYTRDIDAPGMKKTLAAIAEYLETVS